jgi:DNA invertase Pin-like site-specific DNA recombinase
MRIGYARVSTKHQNLQRQLAALRDAKCKPIFSEKISGTTTRNRPQLARALAQLRKGDVFVVAEWDRATRSMMDGLNLMTQIHANGATIKVLDRASLDLTTPTGRAVLGLLSAIYEEERTRIVSRARQGLDHAKRNGKKLGPKPKLSAAEAAQALAMIRKGASYRKTGATFDVDHKTISRLARAANL